MGTNCREKKDRKWKGEENENKPLLGKHRPCETLKGGRGKENHRGGKRVTLAIRGKERSVCQEDLTKKLKKRKGIKKKKKKKGKKGTPIEQEKKI